MIRGALWWADEHRGVAAALILSLIGAAVGAALLFADENGAGSKRAELSASLADGSIAEAASRGGVGASPGAEVVVGKEALARSLEQAENSGANRVGETTVTRLEPQKRCSDAIAGAVVDVLVTGEDCSQVPQLAASYSAAPKGGTRTVAGFTCTATPGALRVSCSRPARAASATLVFGPGGAGLAECGQSPVTQDGQLAWVRAEGGLCNSARRRIFAAFADGDSSEVPGYSCKTRAIAGGAASSCSRGARELAFTIPSGK